MLVIILLLLTFTTRQGTITFQLKTTVADIGIFRFSSEPLLFLATVNFDLVRKQRAIVLVLRTADVTDIVSDCELAEWTAVYCLSLNIWSAGRNTASRFGGGTHIGGTLYVQLCRVPISSAVLRFQLLARSRIVTLNVCWPLSFLSLFLLIVWHPWHLKNNEQRVCRVTHLKTKWITFQRRPNG